MNFRVSLTLNHSALSKGYVHTVYPVLLASADFNDWWVVADRRHAWPSPFWRARTDAAGHAYSYDTESCIRPPTDVKVTPQSGLYVLACVVWSPDTFAELERLQELDDAALGTYCYGAGGVCGWTCDSVLNSDLLEGCTADSNIQMTSSSVAGREIPAANFQGTVEMKQCMSKLPGECETATDNFQHWKCHECLYDPRTEEDFRRLQIIPGIGGLPAGLPGLDDPDSGLPGFGTGSTGSGGGSSAFGGDPETSEASKDQVLYTSLPRFRVTVSDMPVPEGTDVFSQPRVFILQSARERGKWQKLYGEYPKTDPPVVVDKDGQPLIKRPENEYDEERLPIKDPVSKHAMKLNQLNRLEIEPGWCYGRQGPLYLVACAVNSSLYEDDFDRFKPGQQAAPPPFNDRCVAVSGRCAHVCQSDEEPLANCSAESCLQSGLRLQQPRLLKEIFIQSTCT